jgi:hypothetical protein
MGRASELAHSIENGRMVAPWIAGVVPEDRLVPVSFSSRIMPDGRTTTLWPSLRRGLPPWTTAPTMVVRLRWRTKVKNS